MTFHNIRVINVMCWSADTSGVLSSQDDGFVFRFFVHLSSKESGTVINILFYVKITRRNEGLVCYINKLYRMHMIIWREKD